MRVTILGASGFLGGHVAAALRARGDDVVAASLRDPAAAARACAGSDAVVNLAGAPIAARWTPAYKAEIARSRVELPRAFFAALSEVVPRPAIYVSASAIGIYGTSRDATFTEQSRPGDDFLAGVCAAWEGVAREGAERLGLRLAIVRAGLVLGTDGGALPRLLPLFRAGLGGPIASGRQWYSWIHVGDAAGVYLHALDGASGVLNAVSPQPVTNREFTRALAATLRRPALLPVPAFGPALVLGEGAVVVTEGQRVVPERTLASGYRFRHPALREALEDLLR